MRIVIIEDEIRIREGLSRLIGKLEKDWEVVGEAENGAEGKALILQTQPDIIITDIRMPVMDGLEMLTAVIGGENYAVIAGGNEEGALDFLTYATQEEQVKSMMAQMGYISADKNIAAGQFASEEDAIYKKFVEQLEYAQARGPLAEWPEVSDAISLAFNQVMTGTASPEDAAAEAQATIDGIVQ